MTKTRTLGDYLEEWKGKLISCALAAGGAGEIAVWTGVLEDYTGEAVVLQHEGKRLIIMLSAIAYIRPRED